MPYREPPRRSVASRWVRFRASVQSWLRFRDTYDLRYHDLFSTTVFAIAFLVSCISFLFAPYRMDWIAMLVGYCVFSGGMTLVYSLSLIKSVRDWKESKSRDLDRRSEVQQDGE